MRGLDGSPARLSKHKGLALGVQRRSHARLKAYAHVDLRYVLAVRPPGQEERVSPTDRVAAKQALERLFVDAPFFDHVRRLAS